MRSTAGCFILGCLLLGCEKSAPSVPESTHDDSHSSGSYGQPSHASGLFNSSSHASEIERSLERFLETRNRSATKGTYDLKTTTRRGAEFAVTYDGIDEVDDYDIEKTDSVTSPYTATVKIRFKTECPEDRLGGKARKYQMTSTNRLIVDGPSYKTLSQGLYLTYTSLVVVDLRYHRQRWEFVKAEGKSNGWKFDSYEYREAEEYAKDLFAD